MLRNQLSLSNQQTLKISQKTLESVELLQMDKLEILDYLQALSLDNPVVELGDTPAVTQDYEALQLRHSWLNANGQKGHASLDGMEDNQIERLAAPSQADSLSAFLNDQLERKKIPEPVCRLCKYLVQLLDENGYLHEEDMTELSCLEPKLVSRAVEIMKTLDPAGIGAASLQECLLLQLRRLDSDTQLAQRIAEQFLSAAGKKSYAQIARSLRCKESDVRLAISQIAALNPVPGRSFVLDQPMQYICPDLFLIVEEGRSHIILNECCQPDLRLNDYYIRLYHQTSELEVKEYLKSKIEQAQWLQSCIVQRSVTLRRCAEAIAEIQQSFFLGMNSAPLPMTLADVAKKTNVHESTVSRAIRGRYLQYHDGTLPVQYFFSRTLSSNEATVSSHLVKQHMGVLLRSESPRHPLSDQQISTLLQEQGIQIARRTVSKYRLELGVEGAAVRRV